MNEREVRAVIMHWRLTEDQAALGLVVSILPHTLVEAVVAPGSPRWFADAVSAACRAFKLDVPVEVSALDRRLRCRSSARRNRCQ